jgi:hypothetical protein
MEVKFITCYRLAYNGPAIKAVSVAERVEAGAGSRIG